MSDHGSLTSAAPAKDARLDRRRAFGTLFDAPRTGRKGVRSCTQNCSSEPSLAATLSKTAN